ncbi:MAG TPA: hypothetical protein VLS91_06175 [Acidimicrobiales bacterium]|nr:hypothetical protein [Acidimicrobiales bacterium]
MPIFSNLVRCTGALALAGAVLLGSGLIGGAPIAGAADASVARVWLCSHTLATRPTSIIISCADANSLLERLHWSSWGGATALATGRFVWNDCNPYCAAGHFHSRAVRVRLYGLSGGVYHFLAGIGDTLGGASPFTLRAAPMKGAWRLAAKIGAAPVCPGGVVSAQSCQVTLPSTQGHGAHEEFTAVLHNPTGVRWCMGLSISSSVAAGLRSVCAPPHRTGVLDVVSTVAVYSAARLSLFVVGAHQSGPLRPTTVSTTFAVTLSARWWD